MANHEKVLIVEDESTITRVLETILNANGYQVLKAQNGHQALTMASSHCPDLILLDLGLPGGMDGLQVIERLREWSGIPILVVSARDQEAEKVKAFDLGADDYITKPFGTSELLARIRAARRHANQLAAERAMVSDVYEYMQFRIDFQRRLVTVAGREVHLTQNEYKMVERLARQPGRVLTYNTLLREIWGPYKCGDNQILRVNMANIRRKLEENPADPHYILTETGVGYRMADEEPLPSASAVRSLTPRG